MIDVHAIDMRDGQMFHVLTYGQANMPSHSAQVTPSDRWAVIAYVRMLQTMGLAALAEAAAAEGEPVEN